MIGTNAPTSWHKHGRGERYDRGYVVEDTGDSFVVAIKANTIGGCDIHVCLCDREEDAAHICQLLNDDIQRCI